MTKRVYLSSICVLAFAAVALIGAPLDEDLEMLVGKWEMVTDFEGQQIPATMTLSMEDGRLVGLWKSQGGEMTMKDIEFENGKLTFKRPMGDSEQMLSFSGKVEDEKIAGEWTSGMGTFTCKGKKAGPKEGS